LKYKLKDNSSPNKQNMNNIQVDNNYNVSTIKNLRNESPERNSLNKDYNIISQRSRFEEKSNKFENLKNEYYEDNNI